MASSDEVAPETPPLPRYAYRLLTEEEVQVFHTNGVFEGNSLDVRDGFMHLSPLSQVLPTAARSFPGRADLSVLVVELLRIPAAVLRQDWVPARGAFFPHVIGGEHGFAIPACAVVGVHKLVLGADGAFQPLQL